jgi:PAS domain S-box-containing protein
MKPPSKELPRPRLIHTIRVRLFIITGLLFLLNICGGLAHLLLEVRQNNVEMSTNMIERDSDILLSAMIDQETGLRGYITTADPVFLEPFYQGRKAYLIIFPQLTQILQNEKYENTKSAFKKLNVLAEKWYNTFALIQLRLIHDKIYAEARSVQNFRQGKAMFDAFRIGAKRLKNIVNEDTDALHQNTNMLINGTILAIILANFLLLTFIWFIVQQIFNDIKKQLKVLSTTMASYNQGDDHIRMESMQHEEFYIFEKLFNDMIDRINQKNREIEQLELNFCLLTNALPQLVWTANPNGYLDYYNQKWLDYTGMTLEQTQGWGWKPVLHPDDLQNCVDAWTHSFTTGESYQLECRFKYRLDDIYHWHLVRALPLKDDAGKIVKWFGTATDIEDLKHAEQMLVQAIQDQHKFVSTVSHEFRSALTSIQGFSELLSTEDFKEEQVKNYAQDIHTDATRLHRMINDLLDLEKMESGRVLLELEDIGFVELISEVVGRTNTISTEHYIDFKPAKLFPHVHGDRDKLTQIMYNLLSNAIKYSPHGGHILIEANVEKAQIHICVHDQGIGIPKEALEIIFHPYNRVRAEDTRYIKGTGLGLPIVRHLVELHGGRIWAESVAGQGSIFHFILPIKKTAQLTH